MDIPWEDVRLFLAVAEHGSMSKGAKALRIGQPTMSRRIGDLEHRLGFAVFERSVAGATLTARGQALLEPARNMSLWASELHRQVERAEPRIEGVVRVSAPPGLAFDLLAPFAANLRKQLPGIRLEVLSAVRYVDLARREADLALRRRANNARDLVTLRTFEFENGAFASPAYVERLPDKCTLADIDWIGWPRHLDEIPPNPQLRALIPNFEPSFASDDFNVQLRACLEGAGAMILAAVRHPNSQLSWLRPISLDLGAHKHAQMHLVSAKSALLVPRVRAVADALVEVLDVGSKPAATAATR
ncbi:MAG: LysR family transcriptional regulator [Nannocystales bacterium]